MCGNAQRASPDSEGEISALISVLLCRSSRDIKKKRFYRLSAFLIALTGQTLCYQVINPPGDFKGYLECVTLQIFLPSGQ